MRPRSGDLIAPHRAVYDIGLARSDDGSGVTAASGRMVFEITGSACIGYTMRQRMVVDIAGDDGDLSKLDFRISTFESGEGDVYNFNSTTTVDEEVVEAVAGEARRVNSTIEVTLTEPDRKTVRLGSDALFPSQHMLAVIAAALGREKFFAAEIYEGAGTGEESDSVTASIGAEESSEESGALRDGVRHWPVSIGYFGAEEDASEEAEETLGEELPSYQMQFTLYENGVTNDILMDYGDYALTGSLSEIEPLDDPDCPSP